MYINTTINILLKKLGLNYKFYMNLDFIKYYQSFLQKIVLTEVGIFIS